MHRHKIYSIYRFTARDLSRLTKLHFYKHNLVALYKPKPFSGENALRRTSPRPRPALSPTLSIDQKRRKVPMASDTSALTVDQIHAKRYEGIKRDFTQAD